MPNLVLERLHDARDEQVATMDAVLAQVGDERDLVDAERQLLETCRQRITELDAQIEPLAAFEALREDAHARSADLPAPPIPAQPRRMDPDRRQPYGSVGAFIVDYLRAHGMMDAQRTPDADARARIAASYEARADQTTGDTPGLLPTPIVGTVINLIDANRPLITSLGGARAMGGISGMTFQRPKITQHVAVGQQTAEKTALPSQKMTVTPVNFTKKTYGGSVDISRQDMDFTQPSAWDILVRDLADVYAIQTETAVATNFVADAGVKVVVATDDLKGWVTALYTAAMHSYQVGKMMPDRVWCSLDVWAALGSLVDVARVVLPQNTTDEMGAPGTSSLADFRGDILGLPRVVVPTFPAKTCIVGPSQLYEVYEEVIGLLSVIEPSILGVEVAYGGYVADGTAAGGALIPLDASALTLPVATSDETAPSSEPGEPEPAEHPAPRRANGGK